MFGHSNYVSTEKTRVLASQMTTVMYTRKCTSFIQACCTTRYWEVNRVLTCTLCSYTTGTMSLCFSYKFDVVLTLHIALSVNIPTTHYYTSSYIDMISYNSSIVNRGHSQHIQCILHYLCKECEEYESFQNF